MALSAEERKRRSDRMKAMHAAKKAAVDFSTNEPTKEPVPEKKEEEILSSDDVQALIRRVKELERNFAQSATKSDFYQNKPEVTRQGALVGSFEKYILDPAAYPDPSERLSHEPKLARFAFPINYELKYKVETTNYQTKEGVNVREPRFTLDLVVIKMDDETGEPTNQRYSIRKCIMHEDPETALKIAEQEGIAVGDDERYFLNEMRYLRFRDWLLEAFYPKPADVPEHGLEMVIGNRVVSVYEVSGTDAKTIPTEKLGKI